MRQERKLDLRRVTHGLLQSASQKPRGEGVIVALTSPSAGEGVTFVSRLLARELAGDPSSRTLYCTMEALANAPLESKDAGSCALDDAPYWTLAANDAPAQSAWNFNLATRQARLDVIRHRFHYAVIDCAAVANSSDVLGIASLVDALLLVVAAGQSRRSQIAYAEQVIVESGGSLHGCVLNRRKYPIPPVLYRFMTGGRSYA